MFKRRKNRKVKSEKKRVDKKGLPPGSFVYIGDERKEEVAIEVIDFNEHHFEERTLNNPEQCIDYKNTETVTWINITGIHDVPIVEKIGKDFGLHPLLIEDILNSEHRPKFSHYEDYVLVILKRIYWNEAELELQDEQISFLLGENTLITFQENKDDDFDQIRQQLRLSISDIRKSRADFLMYRLIDTIIDHYLIEVEKINDNLESMEEEMVKDPSQDMLYNIYDYKNEAIQLRKLTRPVREVVSKLEKPDLPLISETTRFYFGDIHEHIIEVNELVEMTRSMTSSVLDVYFSSVSNKMNEVMKVLTIVSTIFIPLTFIAGIYGMNFAHMPELDWKWSYPVAWMIMILITILMLLFFRKKKWL